MKKKSKEIRKMTSGKEKLIFNESKHTYRVGKQKLVSVTTLLKDYFSPFDAKAIAKKLAGVQKGKNYRKFKADEFITDEEKAKSTQKYWLAEWKEASDHGTRVHNGMEQAILNMSNAINVMQENATEERDTKKMVQGWTFLGTLTDKDTTLKPELRIYDKELGLAGTIDLLLIKKGKSSIVDWKSNKKIQKSGYLKATALPPIAELPDCNYSKYALQLGVYAYMLERQGQEIDKLYLAHLKEDSYMPYEIMYKDIKPFVEAILNDRKDKETDSSTTKVQE